MFGLFFGVVWDSHGNPEDLRASLQWVDFLMYTVDDAFEGARVHFERQGRWTRLLITGVTIAGVTRNRAQHLLSSTGM